MRLAYSLHEAACKNTGIVTKLAALASVSGLIY